MQTSDRKVREQYAALAAGQRAAIAAGLRHSGAAHLQLRTDRDWVSDVVRFVVARRKFVRRRGRGRGALMHFLSPGWLVLLIAVAALLVGYVLLQVRRKRYVARFSNVELLGSVAPRRPGWRRHLTFALLASA